MKGVIIGFWNDDPYKDFTFTHKPRLDDDELAWRQESGKTTAGLPISQRPYAKTTIKTVTVNNMPKVDKDNLLDFFDAVRGMAFVFHMVNSCFELFDVRFAEPELSFVEKNTDVFQITIKLMEIDAIT